MTIEQKVLVETITGLESKIKKLTRMVDTNLVQTNKIKLDIVSLREQLREKYLELKEVTDKIKASKDTIDS
jgi:hypothetical protein